MEKVRKVFVITHPFFMSDFEEASENARKYMLDYYKSLVDRVASDPEAVLRLEIHAGAGKQAKQLEEYAVRRLGSRLWQPKNDLKNFDKKVEIFSAGEMYGSCPVANTEEIARKLEKKGIKVELYQMPDLSVLGRPYKGKMFTELSEEEKKKVLGFRLGVFKQFPKAYGMPTSEKELKELDVKRGFSVITPWKKRKKKRR